MELVTELDKHFNKLYMSYYWKQLTCYPDSIVYCKIPFGYDKQMEHELNELIKELGLPLVAKSNANANGLFRDTIVVSENKSIEEIKNDN